MGRHKRGPKSKHKTQKEQKAARKQTQKAWYERNAKQHIYNVSQRRTQRQSVTRRYTRWQLKQTSTEGEKMEDTIDTDPVEAVCHELQDLNILYGDTFGFSHPRSMGENWLAQVNADIHPEEGEILLKRAQHLHDVAEAMAVRVGPLMRAVLNNAIEYLEEAEEIEHSVVQAMYIFREAVLFLNISPQSYAKAADDGILFWQGSGEQT
ncbi:hypothetical protein M422DRAFT_268381 [Sphaerobolus stellatus SS14]|uniref:Unplaced genomic scaffold SPHSTscaffold_193, whole genome shotgun sequence n=1 Tax=Sphaerobolus stellatus (strain SS14) TaxID=990650 RepID=A0A0C9UYC5_SPHS4|nr:hypothetical protein M422DRAFT_268381 [Sphaerobolus stellatus SS14]